MTITEKLSEFKADWLDVVLLKVAVFAATLLVAKYWELLLSLDWYWYVVVFIITVVKPFKTFIRWMIKSPGK